jgi:plastocyanin
MYMSGRKREPPIIAMPWYSTNSFKIGAGIAGIIVLVLALLFLNDIMAPNAPTQGGNTNPTNANPPTTPPDQVPTQQGDFQVIKMTVASSFTPNTFTVQANKPVRWIVDGTQAGGCTQYLVMRDFGISESVGGTVSTIEFTPTKTGSFMFSCGMGMVRGTMNVV